ncbi:MAG: RNA degradosome polyphosphate kinase, partial [Litorivicinaceae bacterium]
MPNLPTFDKELSWLSFNHRVLQEAMDKSNPIIERAHFLGFYSSNLDEFYRVRVSDIRRKVMLHREVGVEPEARRLLRQIQRRTVELNLEFEATHLDVIKTLARHDIFLENEEQLTDEHREWLKRY